MDALHPARPALRDRYNAFIKRNEVAWELVMGAITIAWVVVSFAFEEQSETPAMVAFDVVAWLVLGGEFVSRLWASHDRSAYMRSHWIDAIALIPAARPLRLFRLFRLIRLVRAFAGIYRALTSFERLASNRQLIGLFMAWGAVAFICSTALFLAESGVNEDLADPVDALWWGIVTLTTVGYGDVIPVTLEGRIAAAGLMIIGITLFAAITGTITSALIASRDGGRRTAADRLRDLAQLRDEGLVSDDEYAAKRPKLVEEL
jgi:voltage-gated potassium channel